LLTIFYVKKRLEKLIKNLYNRVQGIIILYKNRKQIMIHTDVNKFAVVGNISEIPVSSAKQEESARSSLEQLELLLEQLSNTDEAPVSAGKTKSAKKLADVEKTLSEMLPLIASAMRNDPAKAKELIASIAPDVIAFSRVSDKNLETVTNLIRPVIHRYLIENPANHVEAITVFAPLMRAGNNPEAKRILEEARVNLQVLDGVLKGAKTDADLDKLGTVPHPASSFGFMGEAMFFLQAFQLEVSKFQGNQDSLQAKLGLAQVSMAESNQSKVSQELAKIEAEMNKPRPWWQILIGVVCTVLSTLLAPGIGTAIAAMVVGGLMMSPVGSMMVKAIATKVASDLQGKYQAEYEKEGYTVDKAKELAQQKAQAVGQIIGGLVLVVATVVLSGSIAGVANKAAGATQSFASVALVSAGQGLNAVASSNLWLNCFMVHPEWAMKHAGLVQGLDIFLELITMIGAIACMGAGMKAGGGSILNSVSSLASKAGYIVAASLVMQTIGQGVTAYSQSKQAIILSELSDKMQALGSMQATVAALNTLVQMGQEGMKNNDEASGNLTKSIAAQMNSLGDTSSSMWGAAGQLTAG
jgi:hypothetical protein